MAPSSKTRPSLSIPINSLVSLTLEDDDHSHYFCTYGRQRKPRRLRLVDFMPTDFIESPPTSPAASYSSYCSIESVLSPTMGYTENNSATYFNTSNPCLDFFFNVVPETSSLSFNHYVSRAWARDPLTTLKLICNLRGVRGTGKSDRNGFYMAALWLHEHHPKTLACNLPCFARFGYFKDLPEILVRVLGLTRPKRVIKHRGIMQSMGRRFVNKKRRSGIKKEVTKPAAWKSTEERVRESLIRQKEEKIEASKLRKEKRAEMAKTATERYNTDEKYRFLHDRVSDLFASQLLYDLELLNTRYEYKISLAAKWCPSLDSSYDRATLLCEAIARKVFPKDEFIEYSDIDDGQYVYRVRDRLRKEVLVPLRKALELPEVFMAARRWEELPYNRVPSVAMETYAALFLKHDRERFNEYLEKVKYGEAKIAAGALLPHEILAKVDKGDGAMIVADLQWKRMVQDMSEIGKLTNCIAVCDVSGSMSGTPMEVCVALGLLLSELSEEPWKGKVITFSENPQLHLIKGDTLKSKSKFIREMKWGMNTDFQKVFDQILNVAVQGNLPGDKMVKTVFVFSDMEFDRASENPWETDYKAIKRKFREKGYRNHVPEIVFWNLRPSKSIPVSADQKGVALVSGFSKNMMKLFLEEYKDLTEEREKLNPMAVMKAAISGEEYSDLVVVD